MAMNIRFIREIRVKKDCLELPKVELLYIICIDVRFFGLGVLVVGVEGVGFVVAQRIARHNEIDVFGVGWQIHLQHTFGTCGDVAIGGMGLVVHGHESVGVAVVLVGTRELHLHGRLSLGVEFDDVGTKHLQRLLVHKLACILLVCLVLAGEVEGEQA